MCLLWFGKVHSRCASWFLFWVTLAKYGSISKVSSQFAITLQCPDKFVKGNNLITCKVNTTQGSKEGCSKFGGVIRFTLDQKDQSLVTVCGADFTKCDQNFNGGGCRCVSDVDIKHYEFKFIADRSIHTNSKLACVVSCFPPAPLSKYYTPSCDLLKFPCDDNSYGQDCLLRCGNCSGGNVCNETDGRCPEGCLAGKKPPLCQEECDDGFYGNCQDSCGQCEEGQSCDKATGACISCLPGYKPPFCQECIIQDGCRNDTQETTVSLHLIGETSSDDSSTLNIVVISVGIVLFIALTAIALLVRSRLKKKATQTSQLEGLSSPHSKPIQGDELHPSLSVISQNSEAELSSLSSHASSETATSSSKSSGSESNQVQ